MNMANIRKLRASSKFTGNAIGAFSRALADRVDEAAIATTGLSSSANSAIVQIGSEPGLTIERLRQMRNSQHSSVVRLLDGLEKKGLVARMRGCSGDRRAVIIELTKRGEDLFTDILDARRTALSKITDLLDTEELVIFGKLVRKIMPAIVHPGNDRHVVCRLCELEVCRQEICPVNLAFPDWFEVPDRPFRRKRR